MFPCDRRLKLTVAAWQDDIHPAPLPGSWLYGNMLFEQLRQEVEARKADAARERVRQRRGWWWR